MDLDGIDAFRPRLENGRTERVYAPDCGDDADTAVGRAPDVVDMARTGRAKAQGQGATPAPHRAIYSRPCGAQLDRSTTQPPLPSLLLDCNIPFPLERSQMAVYGVLRVAGVSWFSLSLTSMMATSRTNGRYS